jgi:hypothetical protein
MTFPQYVKARYQEIHNEYGTSYKEIQELWPEESLMADYMRDIEEKARNKTLSIHDLEWLEKNNNTFFKQVLKFNTYLQQQYADNNYYTRKPRNKKGE